MDGGSIEAGRVGKREERIEEERREEGRGRRGCEEIEE